MAAAATTKPAEYEKASSPFSGLPPAKWNRGASADEKAEVKAILAQIVAARALAERMKPETDRYEDALANRFPLFVPQSAADEAMEKESSPLRYVSVQQDTNLCRRAANSLKAITCQGRWDIRYRRFDDAPEKAIEGAEVLIDKVVERGGAREEFRGTVDDYLCIGPMVIYQGIHREIVNQEELSGLTTDPAEIINAAAQGLPVHPLPGMDYQAVAGAIRAYLGDPKAALTLEESAQQNLLRLASEFDDMEEKQKKAPAPKWKTGEVFHLRLQYPLDVLWDSSVSNRRRCDWMARRIVLTLDEARTEKSWKPAARAQLIAKPLTGDSGHELIADPGLPVDTLERLNNRVIVWEFWRLSTDEVHYVAETGGYEGFLEIDSRYPHNDENGNSIIPGWFPFAIATPMEHSKPTADRTRGLPGLATAWPHQVSRIKFGTAFEIACKKAGLIIEIDENVDDDSQDAIERGTDRTVIRRPPGNRNKNGASVNVVDMGHVPYDYEKGILLSEQNFARDADMTYAELSGTSSEPTATQEEMAGGGATTSRGGTVSRMETFAGDVVMQTIALVKRYYRDDQVGYLVGNDFVSPDPKTGASPWAQFKASSAATDRPDVLFAAYGQALQLARLKVQEDGVALVNSLRDGMGIPYFDVKPIAEQFAKMAQLGRLKPFPEEERAELMAAMAAKAQAESGDPAGEGDGGEDRQAPGGGRTDGRAAGGRRGPPAVPNREKRHQGPASFGNLAGKARRTGAA